MVPAPSFTKTMTKASALAVYSLLILLSVDIMLVSSAATAVHPKPPPHKPSPPKKPSPPPKSTSPKVFKPPPSSNPSTLSKLSPPSSLSLSSSPSPPSPPSPPTNKTDPCASIGPALSTGFTIGLKDFRACLGSFKFNSTVAQQTIQSLTNGVAFYVLESIQSKSPTAQYPQAVNLQSGLASIKTNVDTGVYKYEIDFHSDIFNLFWSLNDGTTVYIPTCFFTAISTIGVPLVRVFKNPSDTVLIGRISHTAKAYRELASALKRVFPEPISNYEGAQVLTIDGIDAKTFIKNWAVNSGGLALDPAVRYNMAFAKYKYNSQGKLYQELGTFSSRFWIPENDSLTFTIQRQGKAVENITLPFIVVYKGLPFTDGPDYYTKHCALNSTGGSSFFRKLTGPDDVSTLSPPAGVVDSQPLTLKDTSILGPAVRLITRTYVQAFLLPDGVTGVFKISSFMAFNSTEVGEFVDSTRKVFSAFRRKKVKKVIVDLIDNDGGSTTLAYNLAQFLFPAKPPQFPTQFRASALESSLAKSAGTEATKAPTQFFDIWAWNNYASVGNINFNSAVGYFFPTQKVAVSGVSDTFSQPFKDKIQTANSLFYRKSTGAPILNVTSTIVLSNGICSGACAIFAAILARTYRIKTIGVGGEKGGTLSYSMNACAQSYKLSSITSDAQALGQTSLQVPSAFVQSIDLDLCVRQTIPAGDSVPLQFYPSISSRRLLYTASNIYNFTDLWTSAAVSIT